MSVVNTVRASLARSAARSSRLFAKQLEYSPWAMEHESVEQYLQRTNQLGAEGYELIHKRSRSLNSLPVNVDSRWQLPGDRGWWGFSFQDVPNRENGETFIATINDCQVITARDAHSGDFCPAILTGDRYSLDMREIRYRPLHANALRESPPALYLPRATWIAERVYHNHSHWLTAHLPKLVLLKQRDQLDEVILPAVRSEALDASLRMVGIDPSQLRTFQVGQRLQFGQLHVIGSDRFRPELLRSVPQQMSSIDAEPATRRIYISRGRAKRRRLINEQELWSRLLRPAGFEMVLLEELSFPDQVRLMRSASIVVAPHGAGLTNMMFCLPGTPVVEIADLSFPNPNFYAIAAAFSHPYWLLPANSVGVGHPLEKDLLVNVEDAEKIFSTLLQQL